MHHIPNITLQTKLKIDPFPHVLDGIKYMTVNNRSIIGDQPGLGKTAQAIGTLVETGDLPALIICPSALKENWLREIIKFSDLKPMILNDSIKTNFDLYYKIGMADVFIVNYESLKKYFVNRINIPFNAPFKLKHIEFNSKISIFKTVICDEAHKVIDPSAQTTKFVKGLSDKVKRVHLLTGTPIVNKLSDLGTLIGILSRLDLVGGNKKVFEELYCGKNTPESEVKELQNILKRNIFIQRTKDEVLKDLPDKTRARVYLNLSNRQEYDAAETDLIKYLKEYKSATNKEIARAKRNESLVKISHLRRISARGKIKESVEFITDFIASGEKLVIFANHREVFDEVKKSVSRMPICSWGYE